MVLFSRVLSISPRGLDGGAPPSPPQGFRGDHNLLLLMLNDNLFPVDFDRLLAGGLIPGGPRFGIPRLPAHAQQHTPESHTHLLTGAHLTQAKSILKPGTKFRVYPPPRKGSVRFTTCLDV